MSGYVNNYIIYGCTSGISMPLYIYSTLKNKYWTGGAIGSSTLATYSLRRMDFFRNCGHAPPEKYFIIVNCKLAKLTS